MLRRLLGTAVLASVLIPTGGAADANCASSVFAFFYHSSRSPAYHYTSVTCDVSETGGVSVDGHIVLPGATRIQGRYTGGTPGGVHGCIVGLGANECKTWKFVTGALGGGTNDSDSVAIVPTATGEVSVWVPNVDAGRKYRTIDQL